MYDDKREFTIHMLQSTTKTFFFVGVFIRLICMFDFFSHISCMFVIYVYPADQLDLNLGNIDLSCLSGLLTYVCQYNDCHTGWMLKSFNKISRLHKITFQDN